MKFGVRKPSLKRSIKARTTGKIKREIKSAVNPLYGKKGMGYINDPKKAVYNKVYNKTTVGVRDIVDTPTHTPKSNTSKIKNYNVEQGNNAQAQSNYSAGTHKGTGVFLIVVAAIISFFGLFVMPVGLIFIGLGIIFFFVGKSQIRIAKEKNESIDSEMVNPVQYHTVIAERTEEKPKEVVKEGVELKPIEFDTFLVYNNTDLMQYNLKQAKVGDKVELEQEDDGVYIVMKGVLDFGYIHKRTGNKIDELANKDYEVLDAEIIELINEEGKLNIKVRIKLGGFKAD